MSNLHHFQGRGGSDILKHWHGSGHSFWDFGFEISIATNLIFYEYVVWNKYFLSSGWTTFLWGVHGGAKQSWKTFSSDGQGRGWICHQIGKKYDIIYDVYNMIYLWSMEFYIWWTLDKDGDGYVTKSLQNIWYDVWYMVDMDGDGFVAEGYYRPRYRRCRIWIKSIKYKNMICIECISKCKILQTSLQEFKEVCRNLNKEQIEAAFKRFDQTGKYFLFKLFWFF